MNPTSEFGFLGEEFLTWLWFRSETGRGTFTLAGDSTVGVSLDDFLCIGGGDGETEQTLRHGLPTRTPEATVALSAGKRLARARLIVAEGDDEWTFTLDGQRFAFGSVKNTNSDPEDDPAGRDLARIRSFVRIGEIVEALYAVFLEQRLGPSFDESGIPEMRAWVAARGAVPGQAG